MKFAHWLLVELRDPYDVLGVSRTDSQETIKKAYRKAAMLFHPDRNFGSKEATEKFKEIQAAWEAISDPARRARHDRYSGVPGSQQSSSQQSNQEIPEWETDPNERNHNVGSNYGDLNYCKKYIYETALAAENGNRNGLKNR